MTRQISVAVGLLMALRPSSASALHSPAMLMNRLRPTTVHGMWVHSKVSLGTVPILGTRSTGPDSYSIPSGNSANENFGSDTGRTTGEASAKSLSTKAILKQHRQMPRGQYWEMTFDPKGQDPEVIKRVDKFENAAGFEYAQLVLQPSDPKGRINLRDKQFSFCDCKGSLEKASFTNCNFKQCRFIGAHFTKLKFTNCTFRVCHFLHIDFDNCRFIDCIFENISVAAEHFNVSSTAISATDFLRAVTTNVEHLPKSVSPEYQISRVKRDKAKLAQLLYRSNPDLFGRQFFAAHKELILSSIIADIEGERFVESCACGRRA